MTKKLDHKFWAKYFKVYDVLNMVIPYQELLETIVKELDIKKGDLVLDAGCGTGNLAVKMKAKGAKVIGIDNCIEALDIYRQKDSKAEILVHDLTQPLPFPDNYFDKIASNNVIYALKKGDRAKVINELSRVLKQGGLIVLVNPEKTSPINIYFEHIEKDIRKIGAKAIIKLFKFIPNTIRMLFYNGKIVKTISLEFPKRGEIENLLFDSQVLVLRDFEVYARESRIVLGKK